VNDEQPSPSELVEPPQSPNGREPDTAPATVPPGSIELDTAHEYPPSANGMHPPALEGVPETGEPEEEGAQAPLLVTASPVRPRVSPWSTLREVLETVVLALLIFLVVRSVVQNFRVEGSSMYPTFVDGQYVLVNKAVYGRLDTTAIAKWVPFVRATGEQYVFHPPRRGDVIVFHPPPPNDPTRDFIKRVIGLPGDTVDVRGGQVFVNGAPVPESFIHQPTVSLNPCFQHVTLKADQFYVMGDNRGNSSDSRAWGPITAGEIVGRAWLVYWPASAWKVAPNHDLKVPAPSTSQQGGGTAPPAPRGLPQAFACG
jgi:signal peptidase I